MINPYGYQIEAIKAIRDRFASGDRSTMAVLPTGTGKTITALLYLLDAGCNRVLWLAHRQELIDQPIASARRVAPGKLCGVVKANRHDVGADWVFASVQTAWRPKRLASIVEHRWDLIVVDEAHHASARTYRQILDAVDAPVLGLTATPERTDAKALDEVFDSVAYQMNLLQAVRSGYLVEPKIATHPIDVDLDQIKTARGDYAQGELESALLAAGIAESVADAWRIHGHDRKTIIFCVGVEQSRQIAERIPGCASVSGETPKTERQRVLDDLASGAIRCVANCMVLTEGFDEPSVDCIIMARPTQSKPLYTQCIGRGLRLYPNKVDCLIVDMVGVTRKHTLIQAPVLFGITDDEDNRNAKPSDDSWRDDIMGEDYWVEQYKRQIEGLSTERRGRLRWVPAGDALALSAGPGRTLVANRTGGDWTLSEIHGGRRRPLAEGCDIETVQGVAQDYVRRVRAARIATGGEDWRREPITPRQRQLLEKRKIGIPSTRGEASDRLTEYEATAWYNDPATSKQIRALRSKGARIPDGLTKGGARRLLWQISK